MSFPLFLSLSLSPLSHPPKSEGSGGGSPDHGVDLHQAAMQAPPHRPAAAQAHPLRRTEIRWRVRAIHPYVQRWVSSSPFDPLLFSPFPLRSPLFYFFPCLSWFLPAVSRCRHAASSSSSVSPALSWPPDYCSPHPWPPGYAVHCYSWRMVWMDMQPLHSIFSRWPFGLGFFVS